MGEVWLATTSGPLGFTKKFCIKTLLPEMREYIDYFATEARLGGRLTHTNLVNVIDFFEERGEFFIVQEFVEGLNLQELLAHPIVQESGGRLPLEIVAFIGWSALAGLRFAHTAALSGPVRRGAPLVHRDISTDNVLLSADAEVKVGDFGIAQVTDEWRTKTQGPNAFRGKPMYVSPEYLMGLELDARADIYQIGLVLRQAATGVHPFAAASSSAFSVMVAVREGSIPPVCEAFPIIDRAFGAVLDAMTHVDREKRIQTDDEALDRLFEACPRLVLARRPLAELVLDATAPKRSRTSPFIRVKDLPQIKMEPPPPLGGVIVSAAPDEKTAPARLHHLAPFAAEARPSARSGSTLVDDGVVSAPVRHESSPENIVDDHRHPVRHAIAPSRQVATWRTRKKRNTTKIAVAGGVVATLLLLGGSAVFFVVGRRSAPDKEKAAQVEKPSEAQRPSVVGSISPAAPRAAAPQPPPPPEPAATMPRPSEAAAESKPEEAAKRRRPPKRDDTASSAGYIVVKREQERVQVIVDGVPVGDAPIKYEVDPGTHYVTLIRGSDWSGGVTVPVKVERGKRYQLNSGSSSSKR
jgi:serine/threonine protein kinase